MASAKPAADLKRLCIAALLSRLARGARDAANDEFGKHASPKVLRSLREFANGVDTVAVFLRRTPNALPPDAIGELFASLSMFAVNLADALEARPPILDLITRGSR